MAQVVRPAAMVATHTNTCRGCISTMAPPTAPVAVAMNPVNTRGNEEIESRYCIEGFILIIRFHFELRGFSHAGLEIVRDVRVEGLDRAYALPYVGYYPTSRLRSYAVNLGKNP